MTPQWANRERGVIWAPALSIFGVSTQGEFLESVSGSDLKNGFLNRMLILPEALYVTDRRPAIDEARLPERLVSDLRALRGGDPQSQLIDVCAPATKDGKPPRRLGWARNAESFWRERISSPNDALMAGKDGRGGDDAPFVARVPEMAVRVATIIAAGRGSDDVEVSDLEWGGELATRSANAFMLAFRSHVAASDHSERVEFLEAAIKRARMITRSNLTRAAAKRMDARQMSGVLAMLVEAVRVGVERVNRGSRGPAAEAYRWLS